LRDWNAHYILDEERRLVRVDLTRWAEWFGKEGNRRVAATSTELFWISTVFLGLDHQFGKGPPLLFETMVFERGKKTNMGALLELDGEQWRYPTWDDAEAGHHATVKKVLRLEADAKAKEVMMIRIRERMNNA